VSVASRARKTLPELETSPVVPRRTVEPPGARRPDELLTPLEVAERLKCSRATVYKLIHDGDLPVLRVGNTFRIDWSLAYAAMSRPVEKAT